MLIDIRFLFLQYGIVYRFCIANKSTSILVYLVSWIYVVVALAIYLIITYAQDKYSSKRHICYRSFQALVIGFILLVIIVLLAFTNLEYMDLVTSILSLMPTSWGLISIAQVLRTLLQPTMVWEIVVVVSWLYEMLLGIIVMIHVASLSWLPGFQTLRTRITDCSIDYQSSCWMA